MGAYPGIKHPPCRNTPTDVLQYPHDNDAGRKVVSHGLSEVASTVREGGRA